MSKGFQKGQGIGGGNKKGYIPWNKGRKETRISVLKNQSDSHIGKKFSQETIEKMRGRVGEKNKKWISDRTQLKRTSSQGERRTSIYLDWRKRVLERDGFRCKMSNNDCSGKIVAHHILAWRDFVELRYEINNGITLCHFHHPRKRIDEAKLSPFFQELLVAEIK